jgi:hypothetical protein
VHDTAANFLRGIQALFHKGQRSLEIKEELESYLDAAVQDKMRRGISRAQATRASRAEMGSREAIKQEVRMAGWESVAESCWQDIHYGVRQLVHSPGFSIVAILTLALGIGANTAMFTLVHAVMLKQLPISDPRTLYRIGEGERFCCEGGGLQDSWGTFDYIFYKQLRDANQVFDRVAAFSGGTRSYQLSEQVLTSGTDDRR